MKVKYLKQPIPAWIRIPFSELEEGEVCRRIRHMFWTDEDSQQNNPFAICYWDEHWKIVGSRLEPVHELNQNKKWSGYMLSSFHNGEYKDSTVEVFR